MRNRKSSQRLTDILMLLTGILLVLYSVLRVLLLLHMEQNEIGIIGGADAPTAEYLFRKMGWRYLLQIVIGTALTVTSIINLKKGGRHD